VWRYIIRRLLEGVPVLVGLSIVVFGILHFVPGDPALALAYGSGGSFSHHDLEVLRKQLGFDRPISVQYMRWVGNVARGDLGKSVFWTLPVKSLILSQMQATFTLAAASMAIAVAIGVPLGVLAALHHRTWLDASVIGLALLGTAMPSFWLAILLILLFTLQLGMLPSLGQGSWQQLVMPAFALGFASSAALARLTRSEMLEVLQEDFVRTARSKGVREAAVVGKHALRNALLPLITATGLQLGNLLGGATIIETVFARQGLGRLAVQAIQSRDYPVVQGVVLFVSLVYIVINLAVDISYAILNPRIRYA
jgi:ABC-type dipeptide/oligopeptide/nickel transport system permease component